MFCNKVCLVTGGARGIGQAIANKLSEQGAKVMVGDKIAAKKSSVFGQNVHFLECDVSQKESFKNAFLETEEKLGKVNVLFNNAGIIRENQYEDLVGVNVLGVMHGVQLALQRMPKGGLVVNVASLAGLTPTPATPAYGASKAAVVAYTRNYGSEVYFSRFGIRFVCFCPSFVMTNMADVSLWNPDDQVITQYLGQMALKAKEKDMLLSPESMAENVTEVLSTAENGTVWIIKKDNKPRLVPPHIYEF